MKRQQIDEALAASNTRRSAVNAPEGGDAPPSPPFVRRSGIDEALREAERRRLAERNTREHNPFQFWKNT